MFHRATAPLPSVASVESVARRLARFCLLAAALNGVMAAAQEDAPVSAFGPGCAVREYVHLDQRLVAVAAPNAVVVNLSATALTVPESGSATLTLTLQSPEGALACPVRVDVATQDGTATVADGDYQPISTAIEFGAGSGTGVTRTVSVPILPDTRYEGPEWFRILFSNLRGARMAALASTVTIVDEEDNLPRVSIGDFRAIEGNAGPKTFTFTVTVDHAGTQAARVDWHTETCSAVAGDFVAASGQVVFPAGNPAPRTFDVVVNGDAVAEGDDTFRVVLTNPVQAVLGRDVGYGTIKNDDKSPGQLPRADFNADARPDLVFRRESTRDLEIWRFDGEQRLGSPVPTVPAQPSAPNWTLVGTNDFNGDRKPDLLWWNETSGNLSFWLMSGETRESGVSLAGDPDLTWRVAATGDLDLDGRPDVVWRNEATGKLRVWRMAGTAFDGVRLTNPEGPDASWDLAAVGDLDGDGKNDLLFRNRISGALVYWAMNGLERTAGGFLTPSPVDLAWRVVALADVDRDGWNDVVFQNDATGDLWVYHLAGVVTTCPTPLDPLRPAFPDLKAVGPR